VRCRRAGRGRTWCVPCAEDAQVGQRAHHEVLIRARTHDVCVRVVHDRAHDRRIGARAMQHRATPAPASSAVISRGVWELDTNEVSRTWMCGPDTSTAPVGAGKRCVCANVDIGERRHVFLPGVVTARVLTPALASRVLAVHVDDVHPRIVHTLAALVYTVPGHSTCLSLAPFMRTSRCIYGVCPLKHAGITCRHLRSTDMNKTLIEPVALLCHPSLVLELRE
jgi:hypothetical protein